ncbi:hypothetical protein KR093_001936, partial [Drosophila rubida]
RSAASGVPATTFNAVPRKFRLLAIRWCTSNTDNILLACFTSTSSNFLICDCGNLSDNFIVSSIIML